MLNNTVNTDLAGDHVQVDELESREEFSTKYKVKNSRMLVLRERLDTNPDRDQERSLSIAKGGDEGPLAMELEVENVCGVSLSDVMVTRELPDAISVVPTGGARRRRCPQLGLLAAGETEFFHKWNSQCRWNQACQGRCGSSNLQGRCNIVHFHSESLMHSVEDSHINSVESERPDNWECKTIFENRSSFTVDLVKLQVRMKGSEDLLFDITDVPMTYFLILAGNLM